MTDDPTQSFINDEEIDNFSSTPNFEVFEEVRVSQSHCVSSQSLAETRFHQVQPTKMVQVYLQRHARGLQTTNVERCSRRKPSLLTKFLGFAKNSLKGSAKATLKCGNLKQICDEDQEVSKAAGYTEGMMCQWVVNRVWPSLTILLALFSIWANHDTPSV